MGGSFRAATGVLAAVLAITAPSAFATTHTATFDTLADSSPVGANTAITTQYAGVSFPDSPPPQAKVFNASTHSSPNALVSQRPCTHANATSCPAHILPMNFSPLVSQV